MRLRPPIVASLVLVAAACGDDDGVVAVTEAGAPEASTDAGVPTRDAVVRDAAPPPPRQTTLALLHASTSARVLGITTGPAPHVVYLETNRENTFDLSVLPLAGGEPTVLQTRLDLAAGDGVLVRGGALAWYLGVDLDNHAEAIHLWSATIGPKTVATTTEVGAFWATDDGARVAFSANATLETTDIAVTRLEAPTADAPALTAGSAMNLAVSAIDCPSSLGFRGTTFIGAYCTGVATTATQPLLVTVSASGNAVVRLDAGIATNDFDGTWLSDPTGTKLLVNDVTAGAHLVDASTDTTVVGVLPNVASAIVLPDGSGMVYLSSEAGGAVRRATFADPPVVSDVVASGVARLFDVTRDGAYLLFARQDTGGFTDLHAVSLAAPGATPRVLSAHANHLYFGFTGTQSHAFLVDLADPVANRILAVPIAGGEPVVLVDPVNRLLGGIDFEPAPSGTGLVFTIASDLVTGTTFERSSLGYVDALKGGGLEPAATILRTEGERGTWVDKTYVFRDLGTKPGIYALTLP